MTCDLKNIEEKTIIEKVNFQGKIVLDVGCGEGRYAQFIAPLSKKYVGIDIDEGAIEAAIKNNEHENAKFYVQNILTFCSEEKFDIIILSLAFHEIDVRNQGEALIIMRRLLNVNGSIVIIDPIIDNCSFQSIWNIAYDELKYFNHNVILTHSKDALDKFLRQGTLITKSSDKLDIDFHFESIHELAMMIVNSDDFKFIDWNAERKMGIEKIFKNFLDNNKIDYINKDILLYDKLEIIVLEEGK